ncbi:MAG TPA: hypothetical protein VFV94_21000 [Polyangiaceae bacterium]|nr:hypothetical protein [Polyangiaceae bacterium]
MAAPPADPSALEAPRNAAAPCRPEDGAYRHDGFLLRSAPGVAVLRALVTGSVRSPRRTGVDGFGPTSSLEVGGTPARGLVVGGSLWTAVLDPVFIEDGRRVSSDDNSVKLTQLRIGPFVDFYPRPERGFHASATAALAVEFESDTKGDAVKPIWYGASLATALGHEWFIAGEASLGILARFAFGSLRRSSGGVTESLSFIAPELALTATYQ